MRADQLVMLGVGVMGLYVVYRMTKTDGSKPQTTAEVKALPAPGAVQSPSLVENPRAPGARLDPRMVLSSPSALLLKAQTQYRMRLNLGAGLPPLSAVSTNEEIASAMRQLGFVDAQVYKTAPEWYPADATQNVTEETRFVSARWGTTTMSVPRPKAVELIWQV